jgi:hypothetical protein
MSRSNPSENSSPNPAVKWFEWNGEAGVVRYYDKEAKRQVDMGDDFAFVLLDQLGCVGGWHDASQSGIYSNEVKDTRQDALLVRAFKGGTLAEGFYKDIKDRVHTLGGHFVANCYIAFKNGGNDLSIGSLKFKGAALSSWMDFSKEHRADLYKKGIRIHGSTEGKKGRIVFKMPVLKLTDLTPASNEAATRLDVTLQEFLSGYLKRNKRDQAEAAPASENYFDESQEPPPPTDDDFAF